MRHLETRPLEPTLNIEPLIRFRAIEDSLSHQLAHAHIPLLPIPIPIPVPSLRRTL
jgi:hypothetical protein